MSADPRDQKEPTTGHEYDGIEELDNRLPNWWLNLFYATIIFSLGYFGYYVMGSGPTLNEAYERDKMESEYADYLRGDLKKELTEEELVAFYKDADKRKEGRAVFESKCVACHGSQGQGGIGPNLTDQYWLHGAKLVEVAKVVDKGVADKGMPPWGSLLKDQELRSVVAYIRSIQGTNPPGAKAPQGQKVVLKDL